MIDLRSLTYVEAIARLGSFTRAADELHVAQPAVSAQIARVERELGIRLFDRSTRRVTLTEAGRLTLDHAHRIQSEVATLRTALDDLRGLRRGELRLGVTPLLGTVDLPKLLACFHKAHPGIAIRVRSGLVDSLLQALSAGSLDAVIGPAEGRPANGVVARLLVAERLVAITPPGHPVRPRLLSDLAEEAFVCLPPGSGLHAILADAAHSAGFSPRIDIEASGPRQIREFVATGLGVALIAESIATTPGPAVTVHRLRDVPKHPPIAFIHHKDPTAVVAALLALATGRRDVDTSAP